MRSARSVCAAAVALGLTALALADDATTTTTAPTAAVTEQSTTVTGTVPDLRGRWLVLAQLGLPDSAKKTIPTVWDVTRENGELVLHERFVVLPDAQTKA